MKGAVVCVEVFSRKVAVVSVLVLVSADRVFLSGFGKKDVFERSAERIRLKRVTVGKSTSGR